MPIEIIVALLSLLGTLAGSYLGVLQSNRLVNFRLKALEKSMEKHNNIVERTIILERDQKATFRLLNETREEMQRLEEMI